MTRRAVIWDMDGVLVDTAEAHFAAWRVLCRRLGRDLSEEQFRATFGQRNQEIVRSLFGSAVDDAQLQALASEKEALFRAALVGRAELLPGAARLLAALRREGYRQAIGSSARRDNIELLTGTLGLADCFDAIVAEEDVRQGKPDPQIFLLAAKRLGVAPEACLVVEDAVAGVAAAKAAGMACLAVTNTRDRGALAAADLVVDSLKEVSVADVARLIESNRAGRLG